MGGWFGHLKIKPLNPTLLGLELSLAKKVHVESNSIFALIIAEMVPHSIFSYRIGPLALLDKSEYVMPPIHYEGWYVRQTRKIF